MKTMFSLTETARNNRTLASAVLLGLGLVSTAHAQSLTLYAGGATLPAVGYAGKNAANGGGASINSRLSDVSGNAGQAGSAPAVQDDAGSLFGAVSLNTLGFPDISYCQTGSGTGKAVLEGVDSAANVCPSLSASATGFGAPSGQTAPQFAAFDSPLAQSDITNFYSLSSSRTAPVQVPVIAGAIAIVYNPTNTGVSTTNSVHAALTDSQICQIFSGSVTNWSQLGYSNEAITVVYRSDGSGTSFNFTNHLAAVCAAYLPSGKYFSTNQTFTSAVATAGSLTGAIGASGNPNVVTQVEQNPGAIGYAELANALAQSPALNYATVNGYNPSTAFTSPFPSSTVALTYTTGKVISSSVNTSTAPFGNPVLVSATGDSETSCLVLVDPNTYANLSGVYPIVAVSYFGAYYAGNGSDASNLQTLLSAPYSSTYQTYATNVGTGTGLAWLNVDLTSTVSSCIN